MTVKYKMISDKLEKEILDGVYIKNNKIPTEEIVKRFNVSRNTVRKAIDNLAKKGYVYQIQGSGVFVKNIEEDLDYEVINLQNMHGLTNDLINKSIDSKLIEFKIIKADEFLAEKMKCDINEKIYFVNRIRYVDDEIFGIEYSYYNKNVITYLDEKIALKSIYNYIMKDLKLTIGAVDRKIYADELTIKDAKIMNYKEKMPCLVNENKAYLNTGKIFDYSRTILNYKNVKFSFLSNCKFKK